MNVIFEEDVIVEITNRIIGEKNFFFGKMKMLLFNFPGYIPGLVDKCNADLCLDFRATKNYKLPEPVL